MKTITALAALLAALSPSLACAGGIYGRIRDAAGPVRSVPLELIAAGQHYTAQTDKDGDYTLYVPGTGACKLVLKYKGQEPAAAVNSYDSSVRYDFTVVKIGSRYVLQTQ